VHNLAAACRCVLSEAHIRANVNRGPRRLAVQEQSNGRTGRFRATDDDAGRLLHLYRPQHAGYARWDEGHGAWWSSRQDVAERSWVFKQIGSGATTALELTAADPNNNKNFIINTDGRVGIGTTHVREDSVHRR